MSAHRAPSSQPPPARRLFALGLIVAGVGLAAFAFWGRGPTDDIDRGKRSLLLVTLDTTRADRLSPYGGAVTTPTLDALAAEGVVYEHAYAVAPITLVAHTSMLTGLWPPQHGVRNNGIHAVEGELETLAERLRRRGWRTGAFVSAAVLDSRYGLDQGFETYDDDLSAGRQRLPRMVPDRPASATVDAARAWLDSQGDGRFFLWVHFYDPHAPYLPPSPFREAYPARPYDGEIAFLDAELGRLLEHPRLRDPQTLTAVIGDHGESLGEHGEQTHALLAYDSTLRIPFLLRWPGAPGGARVTTPVSQVDLLPTFLDLLGLTKDRHLPGRSVVPGSARAAEAQQAGRPEAPGADTAAGRGAPRLIYSETYLPHYTYGWSKIRVARRGPLKYVDAPTPELYDLRLDPRELSNLAEQKPGARHDLARDLGEWLATFDDAERESHHQLDAESEAELRSLGYLAAGNLPARQGPPPDPKDVVDLHTGLERARLLQSDALYDLAAAELRQVLERDPDNLAALTDLADNLVGQGDLDGAVRQIERALHLDPSSARLHLQMAGVEGRRQRPEQALALVQRALEIDPRQVEATIHEASLLRRLGRGAEAEAKLTQALESHPDNPRVLTAHATLVLLPSRRTDEGEAALRRALELDPFLGSARRQLGEWLEADGRLDEAEEHFREGVERRPRDGELQARLGLLLARRAKAGAEAPLREAIRLTPRPRSDLLMALANHLTVSGAEADRPARRQEAAAIYTALADRPASSPEDRNNRALALHRLGRAEEARRELEALVEAFPRHLDGLYNLAAVTVELGDWPAAQRHTRALLELRDDLPDAWNTLGAALEGLGKLPEAIEAYGRALTLDPTYWRAELNLGTALAEAGEPERAEAALRSASRAPSAAAEAHWQLAQLLDGQKGGRESYRLFLDLAPPDDPRRTEAARHLGASTAAEVGGGGETGR